MSLENGALEMRGYGLSAHWEDMLTRLVISTKRCRSESSRMLPGNNIYHDTTILSSLYSLRMILNKCGQTLLQKP